MKTITRSEYFQLVGLLTLAKQHNRMLEDLERATMALLAETEKPGHVSDAIWGYDLSADELLERLKIEVEVHRTPDRPGMVEVRPGKWQREDE